ncbi:hypothetical protein FA10DRAFT_303307 [Acaromyces ingoldii]|uniref:Uncharacterized protein n=1 Tax=Acaromyces ingoldii TaxID=215250 RepID=A0A316YJS0_9BASI|nr:hypothetical protein FA10DRAFT_303307 [Acaromyces ingoldii]PWN88333.1 hypothetical protein FA10DRAFT_303307 [Acaromyces ingoldii]
MSSSSRKDNKELESEQKNIKLKPEELKDTDAEDEFKSEGGKFKKQHNQSGSDPSSQSAGIAGGAKPTNEDLEKEQKSTKLRPDELMDTDVEEEYKGEGGKFKKNNGKSKL